MKITNIRTKILRSALKTPFQTALRRVELLEDIVVLIETDSGAIGYGEGSPTPVITGETMGTMQAVIEYLSPLLIGRDIEEFEILIDIIQNSILKNTTAKSALEIALYDLKAKYAKLPLYQMLGGIQREFETDITISLGEIDKMVADTQKALKLGYKILKIKVGESINRDFQRIQAIEEVINKDTILRLDANQGWSAKESVDILSKLEAKGIYPELVEQPVKANDIKGLKYIKERVNTPILADESLFSLDDARVLLDTDSVDLLNIKLAKCGGISNALAIADIADEYGVKCMIGCMLEGPISVGAAVHLASAKSNIITMLDLDAVSLCVDNPVTGGVIFDESKLLLDDNSIGLGVLF